MTWGHCPSETAREREARIVGRRQRRTRGAAGRRGTTALAARSGDALSASSRNLRFFLRHSAPSQPERGVRLASLAARRSENSLRIRMLRRRDLVLLSPAATSAPSGKVKNRARRMWSEASLLPRVNRSILTFPSGWRARRTRSAWSSPWPWPSLPSLPHRPASGGWLRSAPR